MRKLAIRVQDRDISELNLCVKVLGPPHASDIADTCCQE